jgi:hypothetical protein
MAQAPHVNGIMELTAEESATIKAALEAIQVAFAPTDEEPVLSTHGLVSRYNQANVGAEINGDTAEYILSVG